MNVGTNRLYPEGTPVGGNTERRCNGCRSWYRAKEESCPVCGREPPAFNKRLRSAMWESNLNAQIT